MPELFPTKMECRALGLFCDLRGPAMAKDKVLKPGVSWTFSMLAEFLKAQVKAQLMKTGIHFD
jgi:hypothetical protein